MHNSNNLALNGRLTVQTPEAQYPALEPLMTNIIESYAPTK